MNRYNDIIKLNSILKMIFKLVGLVFMSSFPFLFTLDGDFVFDDSEAILKNKDITSYSWMDCFFNDFWGTDIKSNSSHKSYRPLTVISFRLNFILNNKQFTAFSYKVTNLLCHVLCCVLVWITFKTILNSKRLSKEIDISYLAALMFAVHPIHVEAVCGIVGRADLLCGVTFFSAFLLYNKAMTKKMSSYMPILHSIIMAAISMLCKENGVTVLGFCILYEFTNIFKNKRLSRQQQRQIYFGNFIIPFKRITLLSFSIILLLYGRWKIMGGTKPEFKAVDNPAAFAADNFTKIATWNYIYYINILLLLWPQWLCYDWSMGCIPLIRNKQDMRLFFVILLYIYAILLIASIFRKNNRIPKRPLVMSIALIVIPFLPAANIFYPVGFVIAERILYIPSAGYCLLVALGLNKLITRRNKYKIGLCYVFLLLILGLRSWQRSYDWQNEYQLFMNGLSVCPLNAKIHYNVAKVADAYDKTDFALYSYRESLRLYPEYYQAMNNLANLLKNQKQFSEAEKYLKQAIRHKKDFPAAWMNLGIVMASTNRLEESRCAYVTALKYRKNYPDCFYNLGNLFLEMNRTQDAMENWLHAVNLNSKHVHAWTNLIALLDNTDQIDKGLQVIPRALEELPESPSINFAVANIYGKTGRFTEAEQYFLKAINLFGTKVQAIHYANLGVLYHRWKRYDLAEAMYQNALKVDATFKSAIINLKSIQKIKRSKVIN